MNGTQGRSNPLPGVLTVAGGMLVLITCFLPWGKVSAGQSGLFPEETGNAIDFDFGWFAVTAGVALLVAGIVMLVRNVPSIWRAMGALAIASGIVAIIVTGYNIATKDRQVDNAIREGIEETTGQQLTDQQLEAVKAELERIGIEVSLQFGIYLTILGAVVGLAGGLIALRTKEPQPTREASGFEPPPSTVQAPPPPPQAPETWQVPEPGTPRGGGPEEDRTT
jgi:tryptophan-associated transmembrane protein